LSIQEAFTSVAVSDLHAALTWYERLLGRQPDMIPNDNEAVWQLSGKAWLYIIGDAQRSGKTLITLIVDNLDSHVAEFNERGISFEFVEKDSKIYRRVAVSDPEGNTFQFTELTSKDN
jgi:catechol 2,3-dioxygenase-like lactoylglutathione lyase family enzyme